MSMHLCQDNNLGQWGHRFREEHTDSGLVSAAAGFANLRV